MPRRDAGKNREESLSEVHQVLPLPSCVLPALLTESLMFLVRHPAVLLSRFLIKTPEGPPRKDKNLPNVIINEKRNVHAAAHQVRERETLCCLALLLERNILVPCGQEGCVILTTETKLFSLPLTGSEIHNPDQFWHFNF